MSRDTPRFTVITPVYKPEPELLEACIDSVRGQDFDDWEHILIDDGSEMPSVTDVLLRYAAIDSRVRVITRAANGGIGAASRDGLEAARGEFIGFLDHDDRLASFALSTMAAVIESAPDADYLYSDEEVRALDETVVWKVQKPGWSPELLRCQNYCNHFSVFRRSVVEQVGGMRAEFDGSQDYDLVLRVTEVARRVVHVPKSLYRWYQAPGSVTTGAEAKPWAYEAGVRALESHVERVNLSAVVERTPWPGVHRMRRVLPPSPPRVSIIIPTRGTLGQVWGMTRAFAVECVRSIMDLSTYSDFEVVVVADDQAPGPVLAEVQEIGRERLRVVPFAGEFDFSAKCNLGAINAAGDVLLFLNDDVEVIAESWIEELVGPLLEDDVAITGGKLLFPDNTIQHAGICLVGDPQHANYRCPDSELGEMATLQTTHECSAVTGACLAVKAAVFHDVGGFSRVFPRSYNDVDLCLKVRRAGYRIVWTPYARLWHFESQSREPSVSPEEHHNLNFRWGSELYGDPYFSPLLCGLSEEQVSEAIRRRPTFR